MQPLPKKMGHEAAAPGGIQSQTISSYWFTIVAQVKRWLETLLQPQDVTKQNTKVKDFLLRAVSEHSPHLRTETVLNLFIPLCIIW